ncbi:MAG: hypothetical protein AAFU81_06585, partial [Pseudomonadota bacterium]
DSASAPGDRIPQSIRQPVRRGLLQGGFILKSLKHVSLRHSSRLGPLLAAFVKRFPTHMKIVRIRQQ